MADPLPFTRAVHRPGGAGRYPGGLHPAHRLGRGSAGQREGFKGYAYPTVGLTPPYSAGSCKDRRPYRHDPGEAKKLLEDSGDPLGRDLKLAALARGRGPALELAQPASDSTHTHWHRLYGARLESKEALVDHQAWRMHEGLVAAARQRRFVAEATRHDN